MMDKPQHYCKWCGITKKIEEKWKGAADYDWKIKASSERKLREIITDEMAGMIFSSNIPAVVNRQLRTILTPWLHHDDRELACRIAIWVVREWGGISRRSPEKIKEWLQELSTGNDANDRFLLKHGTQGISSWSKVLAFTFPDKFAIYDSRTAVALNCLIIDSDTHPLFAMPESRNSIVREAQMNMKRHACSRTLGYVEYMNVLKCYAERNPREDILDAEMIIFASAEVACKMYLT